MSIRENNGVFTLGAENTMLQMKIDAFGVLSHLWYGEKLDQDMSYLQDYPDIGFSPSIYEAEDDRTYSLDTKLLGYPAGMGDYRIPAIALQYEDGSSMLDLRYEGFEITPGRPILDGLPYVRDNGGEAETLQIFLSDGQKNLQVTLQYTVFEKMDIICRSVKIENTGTEILQLEKAASACFDFLNQDLEIIHFHGRHCKERSVERLRLPHGTTVFDSRRGTSSHQQNPGIILASPDATETSGTVYGMLLMYSGSFAAEVQKDQLSQTRVVMGLHPDLFSWKLLPGESFQTPEVISACSSHGLGALSRLFHTCINRNVIDPAFALEERPILINNWEATYFDFDDKKITEIAQKAGDLGIEMLVLDDGWFGNRNNDNQGLGDWVPNKEKLGGPLSGLIEKIQKAGLKFGIWLEPEMVSEDSNLFRTHPEWVLQTAKTRPVRGRYQLGLNLANPEVVSYLDKSISQLLEENEISYVKWDLNRSLTDWYDPRLPADRQKELPHRYVLGLYSLLASLKKKFPQILFEGCSGGGGRFDAGMLFYTPQIWCSDDTDAHERCFIQYGTSFFYPASCIGAHVSAVPNHQTGRKTPLEARGTLAMAGSFGYELDLNTLEKEEQDCVREQTKWYRKLQKKIYSADFYRLNSPFTDGKYIWEFVSPKKDWVMVQGLVFETAPMSLRHRVILQGLEEDGWYQLQATNYIQEKEAHLYSGKALMTGGILLPVTWGTDAAVTMLFRKVKASALTETKNSQQEEEKYA